MLFQSLLLIILFVVAMAIWHYANLYLPYIIISVLNNLLNRRILSELHI